MTTPVSSPSILLLGGTGAAPATAGAATAQPSSDAAAGGFELLLSALADQQALTLKAAVPASSDAGKTATEPDDGGNALPITGIFLPLLGGQTTAAKAVAAITDEKQDSPAEKSDDQNSQVTLLLNPTPMAPPTAPAAQSVPPSSTADDLVAELAALTSFGGNTPAKSDKTAAATPRAETATPASTTNVDDGDSALPSALVDAKNLAAATATAEASHGDEGTDFSALLKQLDGTAAQPNNGGGAAAMSSLHDPRALANTPGANNAAVATVAVPVGANGWSDAVTDKVMWFSANKINSAEIHLNPSDLGPVQVRISTQNDQTTVTFSSPHAAVRDALDQALPRLRDMMGGQGIQLLDVSVGGQGAERQQYSRGENNFAGNSTPSYFSDDGSGAEPVAVTSVNVARLSRSAVDAYV